MYINVVKIPFTTIAGGGTVAEIDVSDALRLMVLVQTTAVAGAPTNFRYEAYYLEDSLLFDDASGLVRRSPDLTAAGRAALDRIAAATKLNDIPFENGGRKIRILAQFTAGTAPTVTGNIYIMKARP